MFSADMTRVILGRSTESGAHVIVDGVCIYKLESYLNLSHTKKI